MFCRQWVWGLFPFRNFLIYPTLGIDLVRLSLKNPYTRIAWHLMPWTIRFDLRVHCSDGITAPNFLSPWTSLVADALPNHRIEAKLCCFCGFFVCILCCFCCCCFFVSVFILSCPRCNRVLGHDACHLCHHLSRV